MQTTDYEDMRNRRRFDVSVKADVTLPGIGNAAYQCRIVNLSGTGARLRFDKAVPVSTGMTLTIDIIVPGTIIHITHTGEIVWVQNHGSSTLLGLRFTEILSEIMIAQLLKSSAPAD